MTDSTVLCLIVDDEPIAREIIENYCMHFPRLKVIASVDNAIAAKTILQKEPIDLLFLDINMPVLDGISLLKTLKTQPQVIFTTAYKEYAVDAFNLSACDYLLKPFSLDRFIIAVDKVLEKIQSISQIQQVHQDMETDFIFLRAEGKIYKIKFGELLLAEAQGNYTRIVTEKFTITPTMTFSNLESLLPSSQFIRLHRSFIINKSKVTHIEGNRVFIHKLEIPIGSNYREEFLTSIGLKI